MSWLPRPRSWDWATEVNRFTVVYDACVLYQAPLCDLLMRLALTDLYRARWGPLWRLGSDLRLRLQRDTSAKRRPIRTMTTPDRMPWKHPVCLWRRRHRPIDQQTACLARMPLKRHEPPPRWG